MVAPTPVSALLHAVAVVKSGAFGLIRVLYFVYNPALVKSLGLQEALAILVSLSILLASLMALRQKVLKLRLAYSTIGQLGYITLGALLFTPAGLTGGILHIINHAFIKITIFFCAGQILKETGKSRLEELNGVGRRLPLTMACFSLSGLGLIGILPLNGFISKYYLIQGSLQGGGVIFAFVIAASALLNAAYYLPIMVNAFFRPGPYEKRKGPETSVKMLVPTLLLTACCLILGLFAHKLTIPLAETVVAFVFQ
jgi:multicomponent Na+:H+ antiporter subunit D